MYVRNAFESWSSPGGESRLRIFFPCFVPLVVGLIPWRLAVKIWQKMAPHGDDFSGLANNIPPPPGLPWRPGKFPPPHPANRPGSSAYYLPQDVNQYFCVRQTFSNLPLFGASKTVGREASALTPLDVDRDRVVFSKEFWQFPRGAKLEGLEEGLGMQ